MFRLLMTGKKRWKKREKRLGIYLKLCWIKRNLFLRKIKQIMEINIKTKNNKFFQNTEEEIKVKTEIILINQKALAAVEKQEMDPLLEEVESLIIKIKIEVVEESLKKLVKNHSINTREKVINPIKKVVAKNPTWKKEELYLKKEDE
jgi:hypothetical protein